MNMIENKLCNVYSVVLDKADLYGFADTHEDQLFELRCIQSYFNTVLKICGKVYLFDVYRSLGIPFDENSDMRFIGWEYRPWDNRIDSFIDFGICNKCNLNFIKGTSEKLILDFNVDGVIC